jgi:hypothetical protein
VGAVRVEVVEPDPSEPARDGMGRRDLAERRGELVRIFPERERAAHLRLDWPRLARGASVGLEP